MSTVAVDPRRVSTIREWPANFPADALYSVSANTSVRADRNRLFQALTVPEYMETWLSAPGSIPGYTRVFQGGDSFNIYGLTEDGGRFMIGCSYRVFRRGKLVFTWSSKSFPGNYPSMVRIRLQGDFERTTVEVTHMGISNFDRSWCERFWIASLEDLRRLF